jgi:hypothetical protein
MARLRNEVTGVYTENLVYPTRGKLTINYDPLSNTMNGSIDNLEFNVQPGDPYDRYRVTIDGDFRNVPAR